MPSDDRRISGRRYVLFAAHCVVASAILLTASSCRRPQKQQPAKAKALPAKASNPNAVKIIYPAGPGSFAKLIDRMKPLVVHLQASTPVRDGPAEWFGNTTLLSPALAGFTRDVQQSIGSAVLVDRNGTAITNHHLVANQTGITARLSNGSIAEATVIGADPRTDLALLQLANADLPDFKPPQIANAAKLRVGEWLILISNPFGFGYAANVGILSASPKKEVPLANFSTWNYLQAELAIHAGNSGGLVISALGEVVGLATAIPHQPSHVGFVLPYNTIERLLPQLRGKGRTTRTWIGMYIDGVTEDAAKAAGMDQPRGALVTAIVPGGPASAAGIRKGDIVVAFDGKPVPNERKLPWLTATMSANQKVWVDVVRGTKKLRFRLQTATLPE